MQQGGAAAQPAPTSSSALVSTSAALMSGGVQAIIFNPVDRALYLRVFHKRSLFHADNWVNPFQGFGNAALHRILCSGTYLAWQDTFSNVEMERYFSSSTQERLFVGTFAGACNGLCLNTLQLLKYRMWTDGEDSVRACLKKLHSQGGNSIFFRGIGISVVRDMIFGITYEGLRGKRSHKPKNQQQSSKDSLVLFGKDWCAASVACVMSSPLNYCRNIYYGAAPRSCPIPPYYLIRYMVIDAHRSAPTLIGKWNKVNSKLNVGWGSLRVGAGMAIGQFTFEFFKTSLNTRQMGKS